MSLVDGLIIHTLNQINEVSQHSMLMRFYKLEKEIEHINENQSFKERFHNLELYFFANRGEGYFKSFRHYIMEGLYNGMTLQQIEANFHPRYDTIAQEIIH